jgi:hypothetical protein
LYKKFFFNKIPHIEFCPAVSLEPLDEIKLQHGFCIYVYILSYVEIHIVTYVLNMYYHNCQFGFI